jgi:hypothetical protein
MPAHWRRQISSRACDAAFGLDGESPVQVLVESALVRQEPELIQPSQMARQGRVHEGIEAGRERQVEFEDLGRHG